MEQVLLSPLRRYYELAIPRNRPPRGGWPLLLALHGYGGNKESMMRLARLIANHRMVVASLQGPYQFFVDYNSRRPGKFRVGFGWGTTYKTPDSIQVHHHDLRALIRIAGRTYRVNESRVFLLGFSQACSYNYRLAFTYPRLVRGVIAACGGVPGDWDRNPRYRWSPAHVLHIAATNDVWYSRAQNLRFREQLAQRAAALDFRFYKSPHRFPRRAIPYIRKWIEQRL